MLRIPKWRPALPLTLRCKDRLDLFFEGRGHGPAFDNQVVQVVPGIGFKVIRVYSALVTNSGTFRNKSLMCVSGAAEGLVAPLPFRCRFGKGGKLRLIVERVR